jgi:ATP-binding cassette subfamily B protein/subfamily B ATP-binding cassette protein MsbA
MKNARRVLSYFRPEVRRASFAMLLLFAGTGLSLLKPWPLALLVDSVLGKDPLPHWLGFAADWNSASRIAFLGGAVLVLHAGCAALAAWQNFLSIQAGLRGLARVRTELFDWIQRLSLRFHQGTRQGDVIYRGSWDTYAFQTFFQQGVFTFTQAALSLLLMLVVMWRLNATLTLVSFATAPMLALAMKFFGRGMSRRSLAAHEADSRVTSFLQQAIAALPLIQSFTREEAESARFADRAQEALHKRSAQHGRELIYGLAVSVGFAIGTAAITWMGAREVLAGRLSLGQLIIFLAYLAQFHEPLTLLSHLGTTLSDAGAGTRRVFELLDADPEVKESPTARTLTRVEGRILFDHVGFGYEPGRAALRDVHLEIAPGECVALIGPSGAGKTTLLNLLPRFFDPTVGAVRLDGVDLRGLRLCDLRSRVSVVLQEPILLPGTVAENIAYGKPDATPAEIQDAARAAHAADFIESLPLRYETIVGEGAARLSVGERQRINLARAFLKDAPVLVFDEPTSALDPESERLVMESLRRLIRGRTALLVAHRPRVVQSADRIVVLEAGRVTASGSPAELRANSEFCRRFFAGAETSR